MMTTLAPSLGLWRKALIGLRRYEIALLLLLALPLLAYLWLSPIRVHNLTLQDSLVPWKGVQTIDNSHRPLGQGSPERRLEHTAQFEYNGLSQNRIHIRTLDCVEYARLNGQDLLSKKISGDPCDDYNGAYFDISDLAVPGTNTLELKTRHNRSKHILFFGFDVSSANLKSPLYLAVVCLLVVMAFYLVVFRWIKSSLPVYALAMLLVAILLRVYVVSNTHALERSHDVYGHIEYMDILIATEALPAKDKCWSCYHPPYYFATMAAAKAFLVKAGLTDFNVYQALMLGSVAVYSIGLYFAFLTIRRFFLRPELQLFAMGLFAFLPVGVIHSVAINNDLWMATLATIGFYHFVVWWQTKSLRSFYLGVGFACLAVLIKANGILFLALMGFSAAGYALARLHEFWASVRRFLPAALMMLAALLANPLIDSTLRPVSDNGGGGIITNVSGLSAALRLQNEPKNYLQFDPVAFINQPFVDPLDDTTGRQFFWEALLKTAIYGEFRDSHAFNSGSLLRNSLAPLMNLTFLVLMLYMIAHAFLMGRETMKRIGSLYGLIGLSIGALLVIRFLLPSFPFNDFRYIWIMLIAPVILVPLAVDACRERNLPMLSYIGYGAMSLSCVCSLAFTLSMP
jgi:hypothetical protein